MSSLVYVSGERLTSFELGIRCTHSHYSRPTSPFRPVRFQLVLITAAMLHDFVGLVTLTRGDRES